MSNNSQTYDRLSALGLISTLIEEVRKHRPKASRNTIHLAFTLTHTPTRKMIVGIGERLLQEKEEAIEEEAQAA